MLWSIIRILIVGLLAGYIAARLNGMDSTDWKKNLLLGILGSAVGGMISAFSASRQPI